ncbi:MAG: DUF3048 domain-containing protein [Candidatus Flexifilum sp.]|jgi:hypothetical protein
MMTVNRFRLTVLALLALPALTLAPAALNAQLFVTNTPPPQTPTMPLSAFVTNTPAATSTPTLTPSPSLTPSPTPTETPSPTFTPSPTPTQVGPLVYPDGFNSLTGLPYPNEEAMLRRNLIIKISNFPPVVRPQSGLNSADVVYEYEVEGGVTRFAAIYRSQTPQHVGPVRSGRLVDIELASMYQALLAYSGASQPVQRLLFAQPWSYRIISPSIGDNCREAGFCRFPGDGLAFEHTLYANTALIWQRAEARGINQPERARGFAFSDVPDPNGIPASQIAVDWYGEGNALWQWDETARRWVRFTDGLPHMDALDGEQVWADNLVIIEVPHENRPDLFEEESRSASQQINLWGTGRAYVLRDGQYYQGFWQRRCFYEGNATPTPTPEGALVTERCPIQDGYALQLIYGNTTPIMLRPGRTWVMVVRWFGDVSLGDQRSDMVATATSVALSATPTRTLTPGAAPTAEATLAQIPVIRR